MRLIHGDCLEVLPTLEAASFDVVLTDPPYPCIKRPYGCMSEAEWHAMMRRLVPEVRRVLKPTGSAVFILQPNSERVGRMRTWLWEFMAWVGKEWGIVQDAWWWNNSTLPGGGATHHDLMRGSLKACVWMGASDCYRDQAAVLKSLESRSLADSRRVENAPWAVSVAPSGRGIDRRRAYATAARRGGATPFNVLPFGSGKAGGKTGHGAATPIGLCDWWLRYLCPPGGRVLDPFSGSGTVALAALRQGKDAVGVEKMPEYHAVAEKRLREAAPLFAEVARG